jgi:hypothetical protein
MVLRFACQKVFSKINLIDVVKRWLDDHPEIRQYTAGSLVTAALKEKFQCH